MGMRGREAGEVGEDGGAGGRERKDSTGSQLGEQGGWQCKQELSERRPESHAFLGSD